MHASGVILRASACVLATAASVAVTANRYPIRAQSQERGPSLFVLDQDDPALGIPAGAHWLNAATPAPGFAPNGATLMAHTPGVAAFYVAATSALVVQRVDAVTTVDTRATTPDADGLAIDPAGAVAALTDSVSGRFAVWDAKGGKPVTAVQLAIHPSSPAFDNGEVIVLNRTSGELLVLSGLAPAGTVDVTSALNPKARAAVGRVDAFAVRDGVLYIAGARGVAAVSRATQMPAWLTRTASGKALDGARFSALAASDSWLALWATDRPRAVIVPRPVPAVIRVTASRPAEREQALGEFLKYLFGKGALPTQRIETGDNEITLGQLAAAAVRGDPREPTGISPGPVLTRMLAELVVSLNALTGGQTPETTVVAARRALDIPAVPISETLLWRDVDMTVLNAPSVRAVDAKVESVDSLLLKNNIDLDHDAAQRQLAGPLIDANTQAGALTAFLKRNGLVAGSVMTRLVPGDVVTVSDAGLQVAGNVRDCNLGEPQVLSTPIALSPYFDVVNGDGLFPTVLPGLSPDTTWRAYVHFSGTRASNLAAGDLQKFDTCSLFSTGGRFLVTNAISADGADVQLADSDGKVRTGIASRVAPALRASADTSDSSSLKVSREITVGLHLEPKGGPSLAGAPNRIQRIDDRLTALRGQRSGSVRLPLPVWEIHALLSPAELRTNNTDLEQVIRRSPGLAVLPTDRIGSRPALETSASQAVPTAAEVQANRERLKKEISYPSQLVSPHAFEDVKIGLLERLESLNRAHQDLSKAKVVDKRGRTWPGCEDGLDTQLDEGGTRLVDCHHATFVAGLLVGQSDQAMGLVPRASLIAIDSAGSAIDLVDDISAAVAQNVRVINVSQTLPRFSPTFDNLVHTKWKDVLFVGPANKLKDVDDSLPKRPLSYQKDDFWHIIGVAPRADHSSAMADFWVNRRYVQLAAPGRNVASLVGDKNYRNADGASIAVPQVTAAAAMVNPEGIERAATVKARLAYTADWLPADSDAQVWGGYLNVRRAFRSENDLLVLPGSPSVEFEVEPACPEPAVGAPVDATVCWLSISGGESLDWSPDLEDVDSPEMVPFNKILRVSRSDESNTTYRVIFIRKNKIRVVAKALLGGNFRYRIISRFDVDGNDKPSTVSSPVRTHEWLELLDYTAKLARVRAVGF